MCVKGKSLVNVSDSSFVGLTISNLTSTVSRIESPPPPQESWPFARQQYLLWIIRVSLASLSTFCGAVMFGLLLAQNRWTDFNRIQLVLTLAQVVYDLMWSSLPFNKDPCQLYVVNTTDPKSVAEYSTYIEIDFFRQSCINISVLTSNVLTLVVGYIMIYSRSISLKRFQIWITVFIACVAVIPVAVLTDSRVVLRDMVVANKNVPSEQQCPF